MITQKTPANVSDSVLKSTRSSSDRAGPVGQPAIRDDLVRRIRSEIETGRYETPERLERAAGRLLDELERPRWRSTAPDDAPRGR